jgi:hypothetical protein
MSRRNDLRRLVVHAARLQGCTCDVDVRICEDDGVIVDVQARHDAWCPLLRASDSATDGQQRQVIIANQATGDAGR